VTDRQSGRGGGADRTRPVALLHSGDMVRTMYEAFWLPPFDSDFDPDDALRLGGDWLDDAEYPGEAVIVLHAAKMTENRPSLAQLATRFAVVGTTTRTRPHGVSHAVLAVWPSKRSMELAERLASPRGGLCVIPYWADEWQPWIQAHGAVDLLHPNAATQALVLSPEARKTLDAIIFFDGHNAFVSGEGKIHAIRNLRAMVAAGDRPAPADVEAYADASGEVRSGGGARLREYYEGVLAGKKFRNYAGRVI
jgi:hypothetical protein